MDLASKYQLHKPWPGDSPRVLFILDARNSFEQEVLDGWIRHHAPVGATPPQVCLDLGDDDRGLDSAPLVEALAQPDDTLVVPLRIAWVPSQADIDSGPRLRDLILGDPRPTLVD